MKIAVCVKEVPDATAAKRIDPASKRLVRQGEQVLNPFDAHAIEAALQIKEADAAQEAEIVAVCMGPASAARTLQKALALGADSAVHVVDDRLGGSDMLATATVLAAALQRGDFDLVLMGQQAADSDAWVLPAMIAEKLGRPVLTQAAKLEHVDGRVRIERQTETGYESLAAPAPAVVSVSDAINQPRYPSLKAIMGAKRKPVETLSLDDLGIAPDTVGSEGSRTVVLSLVDPPARAAGVKIEDDGSAAEKLASFLAEKNFV